jgi:hypothetical protein
MPRPVLTPDYGPAVGGTKIQIENLSFDLLSTVKIFLGNKQCYITEPGSSTDEIECVNQACINDMEHLKLSIQVNDHPWQLEKTYFQCRANPIVFDWYPKKAIMRY